ncbi:hypothetical protein DWX23_04570 [Parabacteroides sp. AF18-52]|nr:hypothetical protein DWX23_04570 [Parabacteroides sp. AF18-52]
MRYLVFIYVLLIICTSCNDRNSLLSVEEMNDDINYYFSLLRTIHPDLYQEYDSVFFDDLELKIKKNCSIPLSFSEFEIQLFKMHKFLDSHTGLHELNIPSSIDKYHFPKVLFMSDSIILLNHDTLISIDGIPASLLALEVDSMVSTMYLPEIANNLKNRYMNILLGSKPSSFSAYGCSLLGKYGVYDSVIDVDTASLIHPLLMPYDSLFIGDSIAVFQYNSSMLLTGDQRNKFQLFLDSFFRKLNASQINELLIDVSTNKGGSDLANELVFSYLSRDSCMIVMKRVAKAEGIKKIMKSEFYNKRFDSKLELIKGNGFLMDTIYVSPQKNKFFEGDVCIIMGNNTFSAAATFCYMAKVCNMAVLIGDISGQYFPFCGSCIWDILPNSKIKIQIPIIKDYYANINCFENGFLEPDIRYPLTPKLDVENYKQIVIEMRRNKENE